MAVAWLSDKEPGTPPPDRWRWPRRRRTVRVDVDEVFALAEEVIAIGERLHGAEDPERGQVAAIGELHILARDLLRWTR